MPDFINLGNFEFALYETHILDKRGHIDHIVMTEYRFPSFKKSYRKNIKLHTALALDNIFPAQDIPDIFVLFDRDNFKR